MKSTVARFQSSSPSGFAISTSDDTAHIEIHPEGVGCFLALAGVILLGGVPVVLVIPFLILGAWAAGQYLAAIFVTVCGFFGAMAYFTILRVFLHGTIGKTLVFLNQDFLEVRHQIIFLKWGDSEPIDSLERIELVHHEADHDNSVEAWDVLVTGNKETVILERSTESAAEW